MKKILLYFFGIMNLFSENNFYILCGYVFNNNYSSILSNNTVFVNSLLSQIIDKIDNKKTNDGRSYYIDLKLNSKDDENLFDFGRIRSIGYPSELFKKIINKKNHNHFENNFLSHGFNFSIGYIPFRKNDFLFSFETSFYFLSGFSFSHKEVFFEKKLSELLKNGASLSFDEKDYNSKSNNIINNIMNDEDNIFGDPNAVKMICDGKFFQDLDVKKLFSKFFDVSFKFGEIFKNRLIFNLILGVSFENYKFLTEKNDFYAKFDPYFWYECDEKSIGWVNYVLNESEKLKIETIFNEEKTTPFSKNVFSFGFHIGAGINFFLTKNSSLYFDYKFFFMTPVTICGLDPVSEITFSRNAHSISGGVSFHF